MLGAVGLAGRSSRRQGQLSGDGPPAPRPVPPCGTIDGGGTAPAGWPCRPDDRPANPTAPNTTQHPRRRLERAITASLRILSATE